MSSEQEKRPDDAGLTKPDIDTQVRIPERLKHPPLRYAALRESEEK